MATTAQKKALYDQEHAHEDHAHEDGGSLGMAVGGVGGALAAGTATAAVLGGVVAGPVGAIAGAAIGGAIGGALGESIASQVNPTAEEQYWRDNYHTRPYATQGAAYSEYAPAYRYGIDSYAAYEGRDFDEVEDQLNRDWDMKRGSSRLTWNEARHPTRDAYDRLNFARRDRLQDKF